MCKHCRGPNKCKGDSRVNELSPLAMECPGCNGFGCEYCQDDGDIKIESCPLEIIDEKTWEIMELAELFKKGLPPIAGGVLDQAKNFVSAARFCWAEIENYKREKGIIDGDTIG